MTPTPPPPKPGLFLISWLIKTYSMDQDHTQTFDASAGDSVVIVLDTTAHNVDIDVKDHPSGNMVVTGTVTAPSGGAYTDLNVQDPSQPSAGIGRFAFQAATGGTYSIVIHAERPSGAGGNTADVGSRSGAGLTSG